MEYDVLVVGGGPAGISAAIRLKQQAEINGQDLSVCLIEKGSQIGAHILSGNVFIPRSLEELLPDWKETGAPLNTPVTEDEFTILFKDWHFNVPQMLLPTSVHNRGNYIISLGDLCKWMGQRAESMGVDILPGIAGDQIVYNDDGSVGGVITGDFGIAKDGSKKDNYQQGIEIRAKQTIFSEGCRGSLVERLKKNFKLEENNISMQHYGIGLKEVWKVASGNPHFKQGKVQHTINWPLTTDIYGGSFIYHMAPDLIHIGLVVGLDYQNPYLNPYEEFQKLKTHKEVRKLLEGGECLSYGARCLNEGGYHAIPKLTFPGGMLIGDSAGFLNVAKIKGAHNAIKSGMIAAESIYEHIMKGQELSRSEIKEYEKNIRKSWVVKEMKESRNFKGGFDMGMWVGLINARLVSLTKGREPWTFKHKAKDSEKTKPKDNFMPIEYPKKDGKLTFDLLTNLQRSGTNHEHDQPAHLKVKPGMEKVPVEESLKIYGAPEQRFCPAKVYEFIQDDHTNEPKLQINAQNCLHCKCCSIKTPKEYIDWNVPEGGGGPNYSGM